MTYLSQDRHNFCHIVCDVPQGAIYGRQPQPPTPAAAFLGHTTRAAARNGSGGEAKNPGGPRARLALPSWMVSFQRSHDLDPVRTLRSRRKPGLPSSKKLRTAGLGVLFCLDRGSSHGPRMGAGARRLRRREFIAALGGAVPLSQGPAASARHYRGDARTMRSRSFCSIGAPAMNRTCGFPAYGSPTGFISGPTTVVSLDVRQIDQGVRARKDAGRERRQAASPPRIRCDAQGLSA